ncbi:MAG: TonB-dependent receptor [Acidobacteria bacterium]|nr:TonB-dependent receptor [Acidobacteriota bacterium]
MKRITLFVMAVICAAMLFGQTTAEILGTVVDETGAVIAGTRITVRNTATGIVSSTTSGDNGQFRFPLLQPGKYEVTFEKSGFAKLIHSGVEIQLNERANIPAQLKVSTSSEVISVTGEVPLINTTNAEVGVNFDAQRIQNLPLAPNSNILNAALSVPGVSQLSNGNSGFAAGGVTFSVNGMRTRSNNFVVDGTDSNSPSVGGLLQEINNPDTVGEFRMITNQFAAEYGRAAGSVVSIVTKSGTNNLHGTAYWRHNDNKLNSRSNLDKRVFSQSPWRIENQFAGTLGGPIVKNRTFFFGSLMRWTDRQFASGANITGAPTETGKALLRPFASTRPALAAVLDFLPAAQTSTGQTIAANIAGQSLSIPVGTLSGAQPALLNDWQWMVKGDHRFNDKHSLSGRLLYDTRETVSGQSVPPGLTSQSPTKRVNANFGVTSTLSPNVFNEFRIGFGRYNSATLAADTRALTIPSIEVAPLGLTAFNAASTRTAIGLAVNLPQTQVLNNYQLANNFSILRGSHNMKMGIDFRRQDQNQDFNPTIRGRLQYQTMQDLIDDTPSVQSINSFLPGVPRWQGYKYYDYFFYWQDEWRVRPNFTLTYGLRYESPGNAVDFLRRTNDKVLALNNNNPAYKMNLPPSRDTNNWAPRFGFNWRPPKMGFFTGEDKLVIRGGYSRTYDLIFNNIVLNVFSSFPFTLVTNFGARSANGFQKVQDIATGKVLPTVTNPLQITRTIVNPTYRAPVAEQFSFQVQRQLGPTWALTTGWVGTKGTALFMSLDGNPTVAGNNAGGTIRVDPNRGIIRERANASSSIYHSWQTSLEKRLSNNFSLGAHYTWSTFIDDQSEIFNASSAGEVAVAQDSFNRKPERARSTYDRPHRLAANFTWEVPFMREQKGVAGHILGGWTLANFTTFQSGSPFSPLAGIDPGFRLSGIDSLIGSSIRPNAAGTSIIGNSVENLFGQRGAQVTVGTATNYAPNLFSLPTAAAPLGNAGRNILRADGIGNLDLAVMKTFKMPYAEGHALNFRGDFFNLTNTRNFGIPEARINNAGFLNQWNTDGGNRRIVFTLRYAF